MARKACNESYNKETRFRLSVRGIFSEAVALMLIQNDII